MKTEKEVPALCLKSSNPYVYCPLRFRHIDDMILDCVHSLAIEIRRLNGLPMCLSGDEAKSVDRYAGQITAYMNGRIHELSRLKEDESKETKEAA